MNEKILKMAKVFKTFKPYSHSLKKMGARAYLIIHTKTNLVVLILYL